MNKMNKKLIQVVKENPELPIITATHYEVIAEDWGYWCGEIKDIKIDYYCLLDEFWYAGKKEITEQLIYQYEDREECQSLSDEDFKDYIKGKFEEMEAQGIIYKAIIIYIGL